MKKDVLERAINRGTAFLEKKCQNGFHSAYIGNSVEMKKVWLSPREVFSNILILDTALKYKPAAKLTKKVIKYIKSQIKHEHIFFFEQNHSIIPADIDDTSCGLSVLFEMDELDEKIVNKAADDIISNTNEEGIITVYFEPNDGHMGRLDWVTATNALYFLNLAGRGREAKVTEDWVFKAMKDKNYLQGSKYYSSPDSFLYFLSKLITRFPCFGKQRHDTLRDAICERIGATKRPVDLAMRVTIAKRLGISNETEKEKLLKLQEADGGWPIDSIFVYRMDKINYYFGSRSLTTAFAIEALRTH